LRVVQSSFMFMQTRQRQLFVGFRSVFQDVLLEARGVVGASLLRFFVDLYIKPCSVRSGERKMDGNLQSPKTHTSCASVAL
jgi:hypothetical protein